VRDCLPGVSAGGSVSVRPEKPGGNPGNAIAPCAKGWFHFDHHGTPPFPVLSYLQIDTGKVRFGQSQNAADHALISRIVPSRPRKRIRTTKRTIMKMSRNTDLENNAATWPHVNRL
jgi:hypothetical protein